MTQEEKQQDQATTEGMPAAASPRPIQHSVGLAISLGRTVHYRITPEQADQINRRRAGFEALNAARTNGTWPNGAVAHVGNSASAGDVYPLLVTRHWGGDMVNGQLFLDGNDSLWVTSAHEERVEGQLGAWSWPPRV